MNQHRKPVRPHTVGWIPYWNLHPLKQELARQAPGLFNLRMGSPTLVNRWLAQEDIHLAPCSSVCLVTQSKNEVALPIGVAAAGPVQSVYLGLSREDHLLVNAIRNRNQQMASIFRQHLSDKNHALSMRQIAGRIFHHLQSLDPIGTAPRFIASPASASSMMLCRLLFRFWFDEDPGQNARPSLHGDGDHTSMELVIGDEALIRTRSFAQIVDLGEVWHTLTSLPFVFAIWQSRRPVSVQLLSTIRQIAELTQAKMKVDPGVYLPDTTPQDMTGRPLDLPNYWRSIDYKFTGEHLRGLLLFLGMAQNLLDEPLRDVSTAKLSRWEASSMSIFPEVPLA